MQPAALLSLYFNADLGICLRGLDSATMTALRHVREDAGALESVLRVSVAGSNGPGMAGQYRFGENGLCFLPHFPFEAGRTYCATFDPATLRGSSSSIPLALTFCLPQPEATSRPAIDRIYPSGEELPENLLRFYVRFSHPMQRGRVAQEVVLLGPDGHPAQDALYRAPVELWDPSMRVLTVLLDPGRLKRGVGPNRALGSPLVRGETYTLVVGEGMTDRFGGRLESTVRKCFTVTAAVRHPLAIRDWTVVPPARGSQQPIVLTFPAALDWAMLFTSITVEAADKSIVQGRSTVGQFERAWCFTPNSPWVRGLYRVVVDAALEDVCGNTVSAAFDGPLRQGRDLRAEAGARSIVFEI